MVRKVGVLVLLMGLSGIASAGESCKVEYFLGWIPIEVCSPVLGGTTSPKAAPEIDPGSAITALTLAMGGLAVLRGRRFKQAEPKRGA
jgi:hypothetical protein